MRHALLSFALLSLATVFGAGAQQPSLDTEQSLDDVWIFPGQAWVGHAPAGSHFALTDESHPAWLQLEANATTLAAAASVQAHMGQAFVQVLDTQQTVTDVFRIALGATPLPTSSGTNFALTVQTGSPSSLTITELAQFLLGLQAQVDAELGSSEALKVLYQGQRVVTLQARYMAEGNADMRAVALDLQVISTLSLNTARVVVSDALPTLASQLNRGFWFDHMHVASAEATPTPEPEPAIQGVPLMQFLPVPTNVARVRRADPITTTNAPTTTGGDAPIDMVLVIDGSGSMGHAAYNRSLDNAAALVSRLALASSNIRVAAVELKGTPITIFDFDEYSSTNDMRNAFLAHKSRYVENRGSNVAGTLDFIRSEILVSNKGHRLFADIPTIIFTDARASQSDIFIEEAAQRLRSVGGRLFVFGIDINTEAQEQQLLFIAGSNEGVLNLTAFEASQVSNDEASIEFMMQTILDTNISANPTTLPAMDSLCNNSVDVVFVLDTLDSATNSIGSKRDLLADLVDDLRLRHDQTRAAVLVDEGSPRIVFGLDQYDSSAGASRTIHNGPLLATSTINTSAIPAFIDNTFGSAFRANVLRVVAWVLPSDAETDSLVVQASLENLALRGYTVVVLVASDTVLDVSELPVSRFDPNDETYDAMNVVDLGICDQAIVATTPSSTVLPTPTISVGLSSTIVPTPTITSSSIGLTTSSLASTSTSTLLSSSSAMLSSTLQPVSSTSSVAPSSTSIVVSPSPSATVVPQFCDFTEQDVVLVLDMSGSVDVADYNRMLQVARATINSLPINEGLVRAALVLLKGTPSSPVSLAQGTSREALLDGVDNLVYSSTRPSAAATTLAYVRETVLTAANGYRGGQATVLLFTDGDSQEPFTQVEAEAQQLRALPGGVKIATVGFPVDPVASSEIDVDTLAALTGCVPSGPVLRRTHQHCGADLKLCGQHFCSLVIFCGLNLRAIVDLLPALHHLQHLFRGPFPDFIDCAGVLFGVAHPDRFIVIRDLFVSTDGNAFSQFVAKYKRHGHSQPAVKLLGYLKRRSDCHADGFQYFLNQRVTFGHANGVLDPSLDSHLQLQYTVVVVDPVKPFQLNYIQPIGDTVSIHLECLCHFVFVAHDNIACAFLDRFLKSGFIRYFSGSECKHVDIHSTFNFSGRLSFNLGVFLSFGVIFFGFIGLHDGFEQLVCLLVCGAVHRLAFTVGKRDGFFRIQQYRDYIGIFQLRIFVIDGDLHASSSASATPTTSIAPSASASPTASPSPSASPTPTPTPTPVLSRPFLLNALPRDLVAPVPAGVFSYQVPDDTFWDPEDGFALSFNVASFGPAANWLQYVDAMRTFFGAPTAEEAGAYAYQLTAVDSDGLVSDPTHLLVVVPVDTTVDSVLEVEMEITTAGSGEAAPNSRRRADCTTTLSPLDRVALLEAADDVVPAADFAIQSIETIETAGGCGLIENSAARLQEAVNAVSSNPLVIESVEAVVEECQVLAAPTPRSAAERDLRSFAVPFIAIAMVLLLACILLFVVLRRVRTKGETDALFGPRKPVLLPTDRNLPRNEIATTSPKLLASGPWGYDAVGTDIFASEGDEPAAPQPSATHKSKELFGSAPPYRPPPAYPSALYSEDGGPFESVGGMNEQYGPDMITTITTTTTTTTQYGAFKPAPPYLEPPDYATAMSDPTEGYEEPALTRFAAANDPSRPSGRYGLPRGSSRYEEE
ncbi:uncharacterized protein MONBRDRAFT_26084 [Monosiga brevicollis MX1]|uniref:VWFA domain-containing protein n=1 Tax=Monosiga brevicollis TaxID=81824 RepID=A9V1B7_MONBE|nr:uncharacterized protein MONBRDRAFT_26084 [Monosiga brevicollis MX1]EDQ88780.1 predicted protein [Monosiga brevicollis MX1]|eukprot:XP_001746393.1 hypothetical protein [Monosiga brevicollis MX1]